MDNQVNTIIDPDLCTGCGECVRVCPKETISLQAKKAVVTGTESIACGHCAAVCPTGAVTVTSLSKEALVLETMLLKLSANCCRPLLYHRALLLCFSKQMLNFSNLLSCCRQLRLRCQAQRQLLLEIFLQTCQWTIVVAHAAFKAITALNQLGYLTFNT